MIDGRARHKTIQIGENTLIAGCHFSAEIFNPKHEFKNISQCPRKPINFGIA